VIRWGTERAIQHKQGGYPYDYREEIRGLRSHKESRFCPQGADQALQLGRREHLRLDVEMITVYNNPDADL